MSRLQISRLHKYQNTEWHGYTRDQEWVETDECGDKVSFCQLNLLQLYVEMTLIYSSIGYLVLWRRPWAVTPCHKRGRLRVVDSVQSSKLEKTHLKTQRSIWKKNRVKKLPQKKVTGKLSWKKQRQHMWPERRRSSVKPRTNRNEFLLCFDQWEAKLMRCTFEKVLT